MGDRLAQNRGYKNEKSGYWKAVAPFRPKIIIIGCHTTIKIKKNMTQEELIKRVSEFSLLMKSENMNMLLLSSDNKKQVCTLLGSREDLIYVILTAMRQPAAKDLFLSVFQIIKEHPEILDMLNDTSEIGISYPDELNVPSTKFEA
jgi:hypothetical protein